MSVFEEIKEMVGKRLAYKLWPEKEEYGSVLYTDTRALTFVRIMTLLFSLGIMAALIFISKKEDAPLPVLLILGFFFLTFFSVFLFKSMSHVEVNINALSKKIVVQKKRFSSVLTETEFNFAQIKKLTLSKATRMETKDGYGRRSRAYLEMVMEFNDGYNIHFSVINDPQTALEAGNKLADLVGGKLTSKI